MISWGGWCELEHSGRFCKCGNQLWQGTNSGTITICSCGYMSDGSIVKDEVRAFLLKEERKLMIEEYKTTTDETRRTEIMALVLGAKDTANG